MFIENHDFEVWLLFEVEFGHMNAPGDWDRDSMRWIGPNRSSQSPPRGRVIYFMLLGYKDTKIKPRKVKETQRRDAEGTEFTRPVPESIARWLETADFFGDTPT